jgi:hypothetical protein
MQHIQTMNAQAMITRFPYGITDLSPIIEMTKCVDECGIICLATPLKIENPINISTISNEIESAGFPLISMIAWHRDRHIVTSNSKTLTNTWEPIFIFGKTKNFHVNRDFITKIKKGFETKEGVFDEDEFSTCLGDHWPVRNDRRDRRFLPAGVVLNCGQFADLQLGDSVIDPYGNPGVRDACRAFGWQYLDGNLPSDIRGLGVILEEEKDENKPDGA